MRGSDTVLFIDARSIFTQLDRAHREFTSTQISFLASLVRLYRGEALNGYSFDPAGFRLTQSQITSLESQFSTLEYCDVPGLCKVASSLEIEAQGWSLNPGRYVLVAGRDADDFDFLERLQELNEELEILNVESQKLEEQIASDLKSLINGIG